MQATREKRVRTEGLWVKCEGCRTIHLEGRSGGEPAGLSEVRAATSAWTRGRGSRACWSRAYTLVDLELKSTDPLSFTDIKPYRAG